MDVQQLIDETILKIEDNTSGNITPEILRNLLTEFANRSELKLVLGLYNQILALYEGNAFLTSNKNGEIFSTLNLSTLDGAGNQFSELSSMDDLSGTSASLRARANGNVEMNASSTIDLYSADIVQIFAENGISLNFINGTITAQNSVFLGTNDFYIEANNLSQSLALFSNDLIRKEALNKIESVVFGGENKIVQDGVAGSILLEVTTSQFISIIKDSLIEMLSPVVQIQAQNYVGLQTGFGQVECDLNGVKISRTGGGSIKLGNVPYFPDHTTANASLTSESVYKITGDPALYHKA